MRLEKKKDTRAGRSFYSLPKWRMLSKAKKDIDGSCTEFLAAMDGDHLLTQAWPAGSCSIGLQDLL